MIEPGSLQGTLAFVQTVEAGSFTAAAQRLRITKSAVGKSVAQLEQRLGVRLLNRTTRSASLTSEGDTYYRACVRALAELDAAQATLASRRQVPSGRLRVDLPLSFGRRCVAPVLFEIAAKFPELAMEISFNDRRVDLIEEGIDLTVRMGDLEDSAGLVARRLYTQRSVLCAAPSYLRRAAGRRPSRTSRIMPSSPTAATASCKRGYSGTQTGSRGNSRRKASSFWAMASRYSTQCLPDAASPSFRPGSSPTPSGRAHWKSSCRIAGWKTWLPMPSGQ